MDLLPADVLVYVLARLPPRALAVSRGVCRAWRAVADADARCQEQLRRAELHPISLGGFFVRTNMPATPSFFVRPAMAHRIAGDLEYYVLEDFGCPYPNTYDIPEISDCCNGLILLEDHVVNPATKQWARFPQYPAAMAGQGTEEGYACYRFPFHVFDPMVSPHYEVVALTSPPCGEDDRLPEGQEWPPPVYVARVYSSRTGTWEERTFVRDREEGANVYCLFSNDGLLTSR